MRWWQAGACALGVHLMIVSLFFSTWHHTPTGLARQSTIKVNLIALKPHQIDRSQSSISARHHRYLQHHALLHANHTVQLTSSRSLHQAVSQAPLAGERMNALLMCIHNAAEKQLIVPQQAIWLGQRGDVKLAFKLQPSGRLRHVHIVRSSGFQLLDHAAIRALQAVSISSVSLTQPMALVLQIRFQ